MLQTKEKPRVQINHNYFQSFGFPINGVEEKIYKILCESFCQASCRENIRPVEKSSIITILSKDLQLEEIEEGLANLKKTKAGYDIIIEKDENIYPGNYFGILR